MNKNFHNNRPYKFSLILVIAVLFLSSYNKDIFKKINYHVGNKDSILFNNKQHDFSNVGNSIIYIVKSLKGDMNYWKENGKEIFLAIPIVIFSNGTYLDPPYCEYGATSSDAIRECKESKRRLSPAVQPGAKLFILNNGIKESSVVVKEEINYGLSDWTRPSALLPYKPQHSLLTNNPRIGLDVLVTLDKNDRPILPKRKKRTESAYYTDILLSKVDIDGDRIPELIYECDDWEGIYYVIYSKKSGKWKLVHQGGYDGV
jgi:hypothetical protein